MLILAVPKSVIMPKAAKGKAGKGEKRTRGKKGK